MKVKTQVACNCCGGSGYIYGAECPRCEGTGYREEWNEQLPALVSTHSQELAVNHGAFFALIGLVDRQQERIKRLEHVVDDTLIKMTLMEGRSVKTIERIERLERIVDLLYVDGARVKRLEKIIVAMSNGLVTTYPEAGEIHTHLIYPARGVRELVKEVKDSLAPSPTPLLDEVDTTCNQASKKAEKSRFIGEEPEPDGARWRICVRCGDNPISAKDDGLGCRDLCVECVADLAEEQKVLASQHMEVEDMEYEAEMALHDGQLCDY